MKGFPIPRSRPKKVLFVLLFLFIVLIVAISIFVNLSSNVECLFDQESELLLKQNKQWVKLKDVQFEKQKGIIYQSEYLSIRELSIKRSNRNILAWIKDAILPNKLLVFTFSSQNEFLLLADEENNISPITSIQAIDHPRINFVVNANFYGAGRDLIGELILAGKRYGKVNKRSSGFFKVINNKARVGPRSLFLDISGDINYSCQAHPSVMRDGIIFHYILSEKKPSRQSWRNKTYRNLVGENEKGDIVFVLSNRGGLLSVKEISLIAVLAGVKNASLFDGGVALQYKYKDEKIKISFSAYNNKIELGDKLNIYMINKFGFSLIQKSPVYIGVALHK